MKWCSSRRHKRKCGRNKLEIQSTVFFLRFRNNSIQSTRSHVGQARTWSHRTGFEPKPPVVKSPDPIGTNSTVPEATGNCPTSTLISLRCPFAARPVPSDFLAEEVVGSRIPGSVHPRNFHPAPTTSRGCTKPASRSRSKASKLLPLRSSTCSERLSSRGSCRKLNSRKCPSKELPLTVQPLNCSRADVQGRRVVQEQAFLSQNVQTSLRVRVNGSPPSR